MYYYFEIHSTPENHYGFWQHSYNFDIKQFINYNELVVKPRTNSKGIYCVSHFHDKISDFKTLEKKTYLYVNCYWVDLNKYEKGYDIGVDYFIENIISIIEKQNDHQRETILENRIDLAKLLIKKLPNFDIDFILHNILNLTTEEKQLYKLLIK